MSEDKPAIILALIERLETAERDARRLQTLLRHTRLILLTSEPGPPPANLIETLDAIEKGQRST